MKLKEGQVAVVTGGASGIGFGLAEAFAKRGLSVVIADVEQSALEEAVERLGGSGASTVGVLTDVRDRRQVDELAMQTIERFGRVDVLCNNAGVMMKSRCQLWEIEYEDWVWLLEVNLWGVINGLRTFVPRLVEQGSGHVVNTSSLAGIAAIPGIAPYTATKHAIVGLSETLALELADQAPGVGVTVLCPASVKTRLSSAARNRPAELMTPVAAELAAEQPPFSEALDPADVAEQTIEAIEANRLHVAPPLTVTEPLTRLRVERLLADFDI